MKIIFYFLAFAGLGFFGWAIFALANKQFEDPISPFAIFIPGIFLLLIAGVINQIFKITK
ncbi:MAG: hypothetical protein KW804_02085 [Candidatus Doudnabacteria bacterium]|nr:hypothetical protein [Candidatus Doudnabacteria bacterium]